MTHQEKFELFVVFVIGSIGKEEAVLLFAGLELLDLQQTYISDLSVMMRGYDASQLRSWISLNHKILTSEVLEIAEQYLAALELKGSKV